MKKTSLFLSVLILALAVLFQNCGGEIINGEDGHNSVLGLPLHNYFTQTPPDSFCGKEGYSFLMDQYLVRHCGACHDNPPLAEPAFAVEGDVDYSYIGSLLISDDRWIASTTDNRFCGETCNLHPDGDIYKALTEWLSCR